MTRRRKIILAAAAAVALALSFFLLVSLRGKARQRGVIVGFHAVEAGAVIVWRPNYDENPSPGWVTRVDSQGREMWTRSIPNEAMRGGTGPIAVVDGVAIVRYGTRDSTSEPGFDANAAIAFDLETGDELWDQVLASYSPYDPTADPPARLSTLPRYVSDLALGRLLIAFSDGGKNLVVQAITARTGAVIWKSSGHFGMIGPTAIGTQGFALHVDDVRVAEITSAASGNTVKLDVAGLGCVVGEDYIGVTDRNRATKALVAFRADGTPSRVIAEPFDALTLERPFVEACGRYKDRYVFVVASHAPRARSVVIADARGTRLHEIPLGSDVRMMDDTRMTDPVRASLSGELPRFVPFPDASEVSGNSLVMLDLESGTVAWRAPPDEDLQHGSLFRSGTHWIWRSWSTISVFDGNSGQLMSAITASNANGIYTAATRGSTLLASHDTLWLFAQDRTTPDAASIAALELPTLRPRFPPRAIVLTDATTEMRAKLKLP